VVIYALNRTKLFPVTPTFFHAPVINTVASNTLRVDAQCPLAR